MTPKLSQELADALQASGEHSLVVTDAQNRIYYLMDEELHQRAMQAMQQQNRDAIAEGLSDMESGRTQPLDEAFSQMRTRLGFPQRS